jgi:hypothetical protein
MNMEMLIRYLRTTLGITIDLNEVQGGALEKLPFYIKGLFRFYLTKLMGQEMLLVEILGGEMRVRMIEKQIQIVGDTFGIPAVLMVMDMPSVTRNRLIERRINFIVPGKELFLPALMMNLRERSGGPIKQNEKLLPSAQVIVLYRILSRSEDIGGLTLKQIASMLKYTTMAITKAARNLTYHGLCEITGAKGKHIQFSWPIPELWRRALPLMVSPVIKRIYIDELPERISLYRSNTSALPEYSDMNEGDQVYFAVAKPSFYSLRKEGLLQDPNGYEGRYCLEVWRYDPGTLADGIAGKGIVDPLSLYLSLKNTHDERMELALDKIIEKHIW